jgi:hypothetical protein
MAILIRPSRATDQGEMLVDLVLLKLLLYLSPKRSDYADVRFACKTVGVNTALASGSVILP